MTLIKDTTTPPDKPMYFVGIGASAGGLEALKQLFEVTPATTGASFFVIQHLSPDHESLLPKLLAAHTDMDIHSAQQGMVPKPNSIYLIPPNKTLFIRQGELVLAARDPDAGVYFPIDQFFESLAKDQQHMAIGIVLSGTGSDGSRGIKTLKEAGALVIAQEPSRAKFDGMPKSAIATGIPDFVINAEEIGDVLSAYISSPATTKDSAKIRHLLASNEGVMDQVFSLLKSNNGIDFTNYKPSTLARRIERRMSIRHVDSVKTYYELLLAEPYELKVFGKDLLIGVTRFFRDEAAFRSLRETVIPDVVRKSIEDIPIRAWVAGCASGEEAYSLAMLFSEELAKQKLVRKVKIFATDVDPDAIQHAGAGIYGNCIQQEVGAKFLAKYFISQSNGCYQVTKELRQMVILSTHNLIADPPFSNMDLVCCRNTIIYFQQSVQKKVLASLYCALRKEGYLLLGSSENLAQMSSHFEVVNDRQRIFKKQSNVRVQLVTEPPFDSDNSTSSPQVPAVSELLRSYRGSALKLGKEEVISDVLISQYAPPCILLNADQEALHVYGDVGPFTRQLPPGRISHDVLGMVNEDIAQAVKTALGKAKQTDDTVYYTNLETHTRAKKIALNIRVIVARVRGLENGPRYYWLVFERLAERGLNNSPKPVDFDALEQARQRIASLELEVKSNQQQVRTAVEELEVTNEELQSTNEELMSANEELQSTNEELQSVNEELYTVNSDYQEKIAELSQVNGDLDKVLELAKVGVVFLDENRMIRRFTRAASDYINLLETDIDRPIHHISTKIKYDTILQDINQVFSAGTPVVRHLELPDKHVLRVTVHPYNYSDLGKSSGVVMTFADVSKSLYTERGMATAYHHLRSSLNNALDILDKEPLANHMNVLLVDDSEVDLVLLEEHLSNNLEFGVTLYKATDLESAVKNAAMHAIDVCLLDYHLGAQDAVDVINSMREQNLHPPTVVITGDSELEVDALLFSNGVLDIIRKAELTPALISRSIRYSIRRWQIDRQIDLVLDKMKLETETDS